MGTVYVLYRAGEVVACGPTLLSLSDAIRPMAFPAWVDPSFWLQRQMMADDLRTGVRVQGVFWVARPALPPAVRG